MTAQSFTTRLERLGFKRERVRCSTTLLLAEQNRTETVDGRPIFQHYSYAVATRFGIVAVEAFREGRFDQRRQADLLDALSERYFIPGLGWRLKFSIVAGGPPTIIESGRISIPGQYLPQGQIARLATTFAARAGRAAAEHRQELPAPAGAPL